MAIDNTITVYTVQTTNPTDYPIGFTETDSIKFSVSYVGDDVIYDRSYVIDHVAQTFNATEPIDSIIVVTRISDAEQPYDPQAQNRIVASDIKAALDQLQFQIEENLNEYKTWGVSFQVGSEECVIAEAILDRADTLIAFDATGEHIITTPLTITEINEIGDLAAQNASDIDDLEAHDIVQDAATALVASNLATHEADTTNPHSVTKTQVGLSQADNTSDVNKPISTATQTALNEKIDLTEKGSANGVAELDAGGLVPSTQLPSYVDDVLNGYMDVGDTKGNGYDAFYEEAELTTKIDEESGKIYIEVVTNITYRWSGSAYVEISSSLALGETSSTAYVGDRGKIAYDHAGVTSGNPHGVTALEVQAFTSGNDLTATTVQGQIDEIVAFFPEVTYD